MERIDFYVDGIMNQAIHNLEHEFRVTKKEAIKKIVLSIGRITGVEVRVKKTK